MQFAVLGKIFRDRTLVETNYGPLISGAAVFSLILLLSWFAFRRKRIAFLFSFLFGVVEFAIWILPIRRDGAEFASLILMSLGVFITALKYRLR